MMANAWGGWTIVSTSLEVERRSRRRLRNEVVISSVPRARSTPPERGLVRTFQTLEGPRPHEGACEEDPDGRLVEAFSGWWLGHVPDRSVVDYHHRRHRRARALSVRLVDQQGSIPGDDAEVHPGRRRGEGSQDVLRSQRAARAHRAVRSRQGESP